MGTLSLITAPTVEPITKDEVKLHLRLDADSAEEDARLDVLIQTARELVEGHTRRALMQQTWDWRLHGFPTGEPWELPKAPLLSVTSITYTATDGTSTVWSSADYTVTVCAGPRCLPGTVHANYGVSYPTVRGIPNAVTVRFVSGYSSSATASTARAAVPAQIRQAMLMLCAELYARPENSISGTIIAEVPYSVARLLAPFVVHGW
jgi:uncharacterized phiE125 gp8 family phage protein